MLTDKRYKTAAYLTSAAARGELRALDLRFTADEAAAFLNEIMGLALIAGHSPPA